MVRTVSPMFVASDSNDGSVSRDNLNGPEKIRKVAASVDPNQLVMAARDVRVENPRSKRHNLRSPRRRRSACQISHS